MVMHAVVIMAVETNRSKRFTWYTLIMQRILTRLPVAIRGQMNVFGWQELEINIGMLHSALWFMW